MPVQVITERRNHIRKYDLSASDPYEQTIKIDTLFADMKREHLDFETGPLLHVVLLVLSPEKHLLLLLLPALCADTIAIENLVREISRSVAGACNDEIGEEPLQYADLAEWQNETLESGSATAGKAFWRKMDISALLDIKLPFETRPARECGFEPELLSLTISQRVAAKLEQLAGNYGLSIPLFLLGCWQILLWRLTEQTDNVVGVLHDGRNYLELEEAIGLFAKCLPLAAEKSCSLLAPITSCTSTPPMRVCFFSS